MQVSDSVLALERMLTRRRALAAVALDLDGYERWGHGSDPAFEQRARASVAELERVDAGLRSQVAALRDSEPQAISDWATLHIRLIDAALADASPEREVHRYVAQQERAGWQSVAEGGLDFVAENTYYRCIDEQQFRALFGFDP